GALQEESGAVLLALASRRCASRTDLSNRATPRHRDPRRVASETYFFGKSHTSRSRRPRARRRWPRQPRAGGGRRDGDVRVRSSLDFEGQETLGSTVSNG